MTAVSEANGRESRAIVREALLLWAAAFGGLVAARLTGFVIPFVGDQVKAVAAALFLWLPSRTIHRRGEVLDDYGIPDWPWVSASSAARFRKDLAWGFGTSAILVPATIVGFFGFLRLLPLLPPELASLLTPYGAAEIDVAFRLPDRFWLHVLDQVLVVALPEEFFYRGYLQTRLTQAWGKGGGRLLGTRVGAAFWLTQILFAVGHLGQLHFWRLSVFFPSILFGWLRERTGSIGASVIVHAISNLLLMILEASAFG